MKLMTHLVWKIVIKDNASVAGLVGNRPWLRRRGLMAAMVLALSLGAALPAIAQTPAARAQEIKSLSDSEFARLVRDMSEEGGFFRSDNFTSNETSYLHIVDKLRELGATGGAYVGVGPEQNFTYIAKIRPRIAFIIDIRRQAIIQHLMYKAVFHMAENRAQFLSLLLSKPLPKEKEKTLSADAPVNELLAFFSQAPADDKTYAKNLEAIRKLIEKEFEFKLSDGDKQSLEYVYKSFRTEGLEISYRVSGYMGGNFPTLREIIAETDLNGKQGNFLAAKDDYDYMRDLHRKNLIIPVVGDFGGSKAIAAVGDYLKKNGVTVTAFYVSNVEQYLFDGGSFRAFAENVRRLPINDNSLFIRAVAGRFPHPARLPGHRLTTLLQRMAVFLKDFDEGRYQSYFDLVTTNYITAGKE
jgi:hypothetical protein